MSALLLSAIMLLSSATTDSKPDPELMLTSAALTETKISDTEPDEPLTADDKAKAAEPAPNCAAETLPDMDLPAAKPKPARRSQIRLKRL
jgi:hypothetical protein